MQIKITRAKLAAAVAPLALSAAIMVPTASAAMVNIGAQGIPEQSSPQQQQASAALVNIGVQGIPELSSPQQQGSMGHDLPNSPGVIGGN
jgi:hypothetical protein